MPFTTLAGKRFLREAANKRKTVSTVLCFFLVLPEYLNKQYYISDTSVLQNVAAIVVIGGGIGSVYMQLGRIDGKLDGLERRLETRIGGLETRLETRLNGVEERLGDLNSKVHEIRGWIIAR